MYRQWRYHQTRARSQIFISIDILRESHPSHTIIQVHIPIIPQLPLPLEIITGVHLQTHKHIRNNLITDWSQPILIQLQVCSDGHGQQG